MSQVSFSRKGFLIFPIVYKTGSSSELQLHGWADASETFFEGNGSIIQKFRYIRISKKKREIKEGN